MENIQEKIIKLHSDLEVARKRLNSLASIYKEATDKIIKYNAVVKKLDMYHITEKTQQEKINKQNALIESIKERIKNCPKLNICYLCDLKSKLKIATYEKNAMVETLERLKERERFAKYELISTTAPHSINDIQTLQATSRSRYVRIAMLSYNTSLGELNKLAKTNFTLLTYQNKPTQIEEIPVDEFFCFATDEK